MKKIDASYTKGHRERLREKFLADKLSDYEYLELLLGYAIPRCDVKPLAKDLLRACGNVHQVFCAPIEKLCEIKGVKIHTATLLKLVHKLTLMDFQASLKDMPVFHDYKRLEDYCRLSLVGLDIEEFHILYLDRNFRLVLDDLHSSGTINWAAVYPREIIKKALNLKADIKHVIFVHNHPEGGTSFSSKDINITDELREKLGYMGINVMDHLLLSGTIIYSAKNMMLFK